MSERLNELAPPSADEAVEPSALLESQPVIQAESLSLAYGRHIVLRDVNLTINQGEFWFFLGPNGQGKTTLIKALLGALKPRRGSIKLRQDFQRRTRVGFVPQESELNPAAPTTVSEFILSGLVGVKSDGVTRLSRLNRLLSLMGLRSVQSRNLWTLSGGQRQRAMVARALIRDPLLLIVDEPTAGLDLGAASGLLELLSSLRREHAITIAFVTHDLQIAARKATHVALFRDGSVHGGPADTVFVRDQLTKTFGVTVEVRVEADGTKQVETSFNRPEPRKPEGVPVDAATESKDSEFEDQPVDSEAKLSKLVRMGGSK